nr:hypothetical protein [Tanacetum cinerariifolium]
MEYEAEMKRQSERDAQSYFPTKYNDRDNGSFRLGNSRTSDYPFYADNTKIDAYYDLPPLLPCFKPIQPYTKHNNESSKEGLKEEISCMSNGESVMSEQDTSDNIDAPNLEPHDEGISSNDDVDKWLITEMEQMETSDTDTVQEVSFMTSNDTVKEDDHPSRALRCQLPPKEPFNVTIHAQIDVFNGEISFGIGEDRVKFDVNKNSTRPSATLERRYMATYSQEEESFSPFELEDELFSYESPACLRFEQNTRIYMNSKIETIYSPSNMKETSKGRANRSPDNEREQRYYKWIAQNYEFDNDRTLSITTTSYKYPDNIHYPTPLLLRNSPHNEWHTKNHTTYNIRSTYYLNIPITPRGDTDPFPQGHLKLNEKTNLGESPKSQTIKPRPYDYSFKEWLNFKVGHTNVAIFDWEKVLNEWVLDSFDIEDNYAKKFANPYSRRFDEYRRVFNNEVEQLSNENILRIGKKGHEEEELWKTRIEKTEYESPMVNVEIFKVKRDELGTEGSAQRAT